jgi:hypothetical protein
VARVELVPFRKIDGSEFFGNFLRRGLHSFAASRMGEDTNGFTASLDALRQPKAGFSANSKAL